jgi:glyoxylase-like metal-dependent hydrolase (beta-lactamase superfamily II)/ferredoxin
MANPARRLPNNITGDFFVDNTCIDCDTCRQIAPETFREDDGWSVVYHQPATSEAERRGLMALIACPTGSIGTTKRHSITEAVAGFPDPVAENVYYCGFTSANSFGASSYLIVRPEGNVLVDSPRFTKALVKRLEQMGGIKLMFLTHRDDVADHQTFHRHFGCERVMHEDDISCGTRNVEQRIEGPKPVALADDLVAIPVPGHTRGHMCLLYREKFLFTGDHLAWDDEDEMLYAFRDYCWYSWAEQTHSMEKLRAFSFEWVLPGHGRRYRAKTSEEMQQQLQACIEWMKQQH